MSVLDALATARAAGIEVELDAGDLVVSAAGELPAYILDLLRTNKPAIVEHLRAQASPIPSAPPPSLSPAQPRGWSAADWRLFHNDRQLVAELALGKTRQQARTYAYVRCIREWCRVRPGATEEQAIAALVEKGIADPSPPPAPAWHKAAIVEHLQATGAEVLGLAAGDIIGAAPIIAGADITAPQRPQGEEWSAAEWVTYYDERAGIAELDRGLARPAAEARAFDDCVVEWQYQNGVISPLGPCPICGAADKPNDQLLPIGIFGGRAWLHIGCVKSWRTARNAQAVSSLVSMGIRGPGAGTT